MSAGDPPPAVRDDRDQGRFAVERDGAVAELVYEAEPGQLIIVHTEVPEVLGGRGVGGQLVRAAVARAAAEGLTVVPWCPFARRWLADHPDVAGIVTIDWGPPPGHDRDPYVKPAGEEWADG
ncbi:MAG: GNAT family N-acetyltransferase [Frankiaceae bacterium]